MMPGAYFEERIYNRVGEFPHLSGGEQEKNDGQLKRERRTDENPSPPVDLLVEPSDPYVASPLRPTTLAQYVCHDLASLSPIQGYYSYSSYPIIYANVKYSKE
jgi:hypothetical protein